MRGSSPYLVVVYYTFLSSLCPFLGPSYLGTMAQQDSEDVISVECAESSLEGYDFQAEPAVGFTLYWKLSPDLETISFTAVLNAELPGWVAIGFSSNGFMVGSDAVVAIPSQGIATEYDLDSRIAAFIDPSPEQEITETFMEKAAGQTTLGFTRPTDPIGEGKLSLMTGTGGPTILLWAFGVSETLNYHFEGRGAISVDLFCSSSTELEEAVDSVRPTPAPIFGDREMFTDSPTAAPTVSFAEVVQPRDGDEAETSVAARAAPNTRFLVARLSSVSGVGGWRSVGAAFGLAVGIIAVALIVV